MQKLLEIFRATADQTRLRMLKMLSVKPLCVCEVMSVLDMAQSTTSRHLRILLCAGLVEEKPGGVWTVYRLAQEPTPACAAILKLVRSAECTKDVQRDKLRAKKADRNRICRKKIEKQFAKLSRMTAKQRT